MSEDKFAELREALAKTSPAPWHAGTECQGRCCWHIFQGLPIYDSKDFPVVMNECSEKDAALMVATRNQLPALLADFDALRKAVQGLLNALPSATTHPAIKAARAALGENSC